MRRVLPSRIVVAILVISLLVAACRPADQPGAPGEDVATATAPIDIPVTGTSPVEPSRTATLAVAAPTEGGANMCASEGRTGAVRIAAERPDDSAPPQADDWDTFDGIEALVWASSWIVQAHIVAPCPSSDYLGLAAYVVQVERTFRGTTRDFIVVLGIGDRYGSRPDPGIGDEIVLFLSATDEAHVDKPTWVMGGSQGSWHIRDGLASTEYNALTLTLDELEMAIAVALNGDPLNELPGSAIALDVSPPGPDLPPVDGLRPAGCGGEIFPMAHQGRETLRLLWSSQHVFAGTIIERLPSFQLDDASPETDPLLRPVVTDYLVRIDEPIRGLPGDIIRIRRLGGELGGCAVTNGEGQLLEVGQRAFMFVWTPEPEADDPTYYLNGSGDGFWRFEDDGALVVQSTSHHQTTTIVPAQQLANGLRSALDSIPITYDGYGLEPVSLEDAPVAHPQPWPPFMLDPMLTWISYRHHDHGLQLDHPEGWTIVESDVSGGVSLANFPTVGDDEESIPDGGLKIVIEPLIEHGYGSNTPISIGRGAYLGKIYFFPGGRGDTYPVYVSYEVDGQIWGIVGYFKELPDLDNPNMRIFLAVVGSVLHGVVSISIHTEEEAITYGMEIMNGLGAANPRLVSVDQMTLKEALVASAIETGENPELVMEGYAEADGERIVWRLVFDGDTFHVPKCPPPEDISAPAAGCGFGTSAGIIIEAATGRLQSLWIRDMVED